MKEKITPYQLASKPLCFSS